MALARIAAAESAANAAINEDDGPAKDGSTLKDLGTFYYLGFNHLFDNWYLSGSGATTKPSSPKFRIGLQHGSGDLDPGEADFENYRIVIEDSSGDLLGYQAETVSAGRTYGSNKIVFSINVAGVEPLLARAAGDDAAAVRVPSSTKDFTNVRLSNQVSSRAVSPYYGRGWITAFSTGVPIRGDLSHGNVGVVNAGTNLFPVFNAAYADTPVEYFDFPSNVFESDGSYTIKAWAEDDDGTRISPQASIVLSAQEGQPVTNSLYLGYGADTRSWSTEPDQATRELTVYGFSIQDE